MGQVHRVVDRLRQTKNFNWEGHSNLAVAAGEVGGYRDTGCAMIPCYSSFIQVFQSTFIVQNYLPTAAEVTVSAAGKVAQIQNLLTGKDIKPAPAPEPGFHGFGLGFGGRGPSNESLRTRFTFTVLPHPYMAFAAK